MRGSMSVITGFLALAIASPAMAQSVKLGYVNSQQIVQEAPGYLEATQTLEEESAAIQTEVQEMDTQLQGMIQEFQQQAMTMSDSARTAREEEIRQTQLEYQGRIQELQQQAAQREQELLQPIIARINAVIEEIRREGSYTMIFDGAAVGILAADPGLDVTPQVIRRLNEQAGVTPTDSADDGNQ